MGWGTSEVGCAVGSKRPGPAQPRLVRAVAGPRLALPPALRGFALAHPPTLRLPVSHKVARFLRVFGQPYATAATLDAHRGRPDYLESVNCRWLVVKVGAGATPCHKGASYALRSEFGLHNSVISGQMGPNSLRKA